LITEQLQKLSVGQLVQVLGELRQEDGSSQIYVEALIIRDFTGVDPKLYHEAISAQVRHLKEANDIKSTILNNECMISYVCIILFGIK